MNTNQKTFQALELEPTTKMATNKPYTMLSLIICLVIVMFLGGCTRVVMAIAGMDPDTVEITGIPRVSTTAYDEIAEKIPALATPLMDNAVIIAPSYDKTEEWVIASDATQKSALALQKHVYDNIGSRRSLSEMRGVLIPGTTYNLNVFHAHGLPKALSIKGLFKTLKLERDDDPQKWMNGSGTAIIIDLTKKNQIHYHVVSNGQSASEDSFSLFPEHGTPKEINTFADWVASLVLKFKNPEVSPNVSPKDMPTKKSNSIEDRLQFLKSLHDRKLISGEEYKLKKKALIEQL